MSAQTITAVSSIAGTLTIPAHGRAPGDGPAALFAQPGGVIPTGLAPVTDYYVIVVDANTIKLASSSANALANIPLTFSSSGTLPLQLLIGIPYRRARTYVPSSVSVPGSQVKSADMNSFEDFDTVMWNLLTGQPQSILNGIRLANSAEASVGPIGANLDYLGNARSLVDHNGYRMGQTTERDETWGGVPTTINVPLFDALVSSGTWASAAGSGSWSNTASGSLTLSLDDAVPLGAVITSIVVSFSRGTTGDTTAFSLVGTRAGGAGAITLTGKTISSGTGATTTDVMVSPAAGFAPVQMGAAAGISFVNTFLQIATTITSSFTLYGVTITYTLPPPGWAYTQATMGQAATADLVVLADPQSGLNQRAIQLKGAAAASTAGASLIAGNNEVFMDANSAFVMEWMCKTGTITDGSAHRMFAMGLGQLITGAAPGISIYNDNTFANWQLRTILTSTVTTDTGIAVVANTVYRFRLEVFGSNVSSAGAGNVRVRLYVNGVKVVDVTPATAGIGAIAPKFFAGTNGTTGGPYDLTIGRLRRAWNHLLAGDNL